MDLAYQHGDMLGTSWTIVLTTLQHLSWMIGLRITPSTSLILQHAPNSTSSMTLVGSSSQFSVPSPVSSKKAACAAILGIDASSIFWTGQHQSAPAASSVHTASVGPSGSSSGSSSGSANNGAVSIIPGPSCGIGLGGTNTVSPFGLPGNLVLANGLINELPHLSNLLSLLFEGSRRLDGSSLMHLIRALCHLAAETSNVASLNKVVISYALKVIEVLIITEHLMSTALSFFEDREYVSSFVSSLTELEDPSLFPITKLTEAGLVNIDRLSL
ncbi:unnamed protein product [Protopolystoma xenopodis]|uniref:Uncharacterized protein n=1 Tax=Protopolystoma xenopodis TaxID=117903 RepID=A0A3S4ZM62_9PLAT|nr:unnamed protein product [Protopolystoma xenopodis]